MVYGTLNSNDQICWHCFISLTNKTFTLRKWFKALIIIFIYKCECKLGERYRNNEIIQKKTSVIVCV